jgi:glutamine synthetase
MGLKESVLKKIREQSIQVIFLQFTDINGTIKSVMKPASELETVIKRGGWFDGSSIQGLFRIQESDARLNPDLSTFTIVPWSDDHRKEARIICHVCMPIKGKPKNFEGDPRYVLKKEEAETRKLGFIYKAGLETEFFIFRKREEDSDELIPYDTAGYFDYSKDGAIAIKKEIIDCLQKSGISVESATHEVAPGQYEIDIRYDNALKTADNIVALKSTIQAIIPKFNAFATFMPKPIAGVNGSGMHTHQSLFDLDGNNIFYDSSDKYGLSEIAYQFIAGQLEHARALCAIVAPTVNSYKRLVSGYEAPVNICWARKNRSALIRIPAVSDKNSTRAEIRCPDPSTNVYLALAVLQAAGRDGIKRKLQCPEPVEENVFHLSEDEYKRRNIGVLPGSLLEAIGELKKDKVLMEALGPHLSREFMRVKTQEWNELRTEVTPKEREMYL